MGDKFIDIPPIIGHAGQAMNKANSRVSSPAPAAA